MGGRKRIDMRVSYITALLLQNWNMSGRNECRISLGWRTTTILLMRQIPLDEPFVQPNDGIDVTKCHTMKLEAIQMESLHPPH